MSLLHDLVKRAPAAMVDGRLVQVLDLPLQQIYEVDQPLWLGRIILNANGSSVLGVEKWVDAKGKALRRGIVVCLDDVEVNDLHSIGPNKLGSKNYVVEREAQHGFEVHGGHVVKLNRCTSKYTYGDGLYGGAGTSSSPGRIPAPTPVEVTVKGFIAFECGRQGIAWVVGADLIVEDFVIDGVARSAIDLEANTSAQRTERVLFRNGRITKRYPNFPIASKGQGVIADITFDHVHFEIWENRIGNNLPLRGPITFVDCTADASGDGQSQTANQAQGLGLYLADVVLLRCDFGPVVQEDRLSWVWRDKTPASSRRLWILDCNLHGSGVIHPDSIGVQMGNRLNGELVEPTVSGVFEFPRLAQLPRQAA